MRLERFHQAKQAEVAALRLAAERGTLPEPLTSPRPDFAAALSLPALGAPLAVVAEYKRASPSRGVIREDLDVEEVVRQYAAAGADALSILTEETWFHGSLDFLTRAAAPGLYPAAPLPLLRKDFIFDSLQVRASLWPDPARRKTAKSGWRPAASATRNIWSRPPKRATRPPWWVRL